MHAAVGLRRPTVGLFGPTDPRVWDPMTPRHRVLRDPDAAGRRVRDGGGTALGGIGVDEVIAQMKLALEAAS